MFTDFVFILKSQTLQLPAQHLQIRPKAFFKNQTLTQNQSGFYTNQCLGNKYSAGPYKGEFTPCSPSALYRPAQTHRCSLGGAIPTWCMVSVRAPRENLCKVAAGANHSNIKLACHNIGPTPFLLYRAAIRFLHGLSNLEDGAFTGHMFWVELFIFFVTFMKKSSEQTKKVTLSKKET